MTAESQGFLALGAGLALLAVAAGAFGAHGLEGRLTADGQATFATAVDYHMYHAVALLLVGLLVGRFSRRLLVWAGWFFVTGTVLFSGSLYLLALTGARWLGLVTPFGGVCFLIGWFCVFWTFYRGASPDMSSG